MTWKNANSARDPLAAGAVNGLVETFSWTLAAHVKVLLALTHTERRALLGASGPKSRAFRHDVGLLALERAQKKRVADALVLFDDLVPLRDHSAATRRATHHAVAASRRRQTRARSW